jgi:hypothetical protein
MAIAAKRDQVVFGVVVYATTELPVVNFQL